MNWNEAVRAVKAGRKIRRTVWRKNVYVVNYPYTALNCWGESVQIDQPCFVGDSLYGMNQYYPCLDDKQAQDWLIIPDDNLDGRTE